MNRLKGQRCYLCGPMDRCPDGGTQWRETLTPFLTKMGIIVLNPLKKPIEIALENAENRQKRQDWKFTGAYSKVAEVMKVIRKIDLRMVDISDFMVVNWDLDIPLCGTAEELFLANRQKKPIILCCPQKKLNVPDWLFAVLPNEMLYGDWPSVKNYLTLVDDPTSFGYDNHLSQKKTSQTVGNARVVKTPQYKVSDRWVFFDWPKMYVSEKETI